MKLAIVGGGISGLAAAWQAHCDGVPFTLFEAGPRLGGLVCSEEMDGLVVEAGADSSLRSKPDLLELCQELGIETEVVSTKPENAGAFVVRDNRLHPIPKGFRLMAPSLLWPFLRSDLISWSGKFRVGLDLLLPVRDRSADKEEESLAEFVSRRLGSELLHYLAQPLVAGIYGADPQTLSLEATMPLFQRLEQEHGSIIRGLRSLGNDEQSQGARYNLFFSLKGGLGAVVSELQKRLPDDSLKTSTRVDSLQRVDGRWQLRCRGAKPQGFDAVLLALPAPLAADVLAPDAESLSKLLKRVTYRPAVTVNLAYPREDYLRCVPRAYGFVVPAQERLPLLACTFTSRKWPERGSEETGTLRTYFGGPHMTWAKSASDEDLVAISRQELERLLGLEVAPTEFRVHRWPMGLPEYRVGHRKLVKKIRESLVDLPGLELSGNYFAGVGLPDCVKQARRSVTRLVQTS